MVKSHGHALPRILHSLVKGTGLGTQTTLERLPKMLLERLWVGNIYGPDKASQLTLATTATAATGTATAAHLK